MVGHKFGGICAALPEIFQEKPMDGRCRGHRFLRIFAAYEFINFLAKKDTLKKCSGRKGTTIPSLGNLKHPNKTDKKPRNQHLNSRDNPKTTKPPEPNIYIREERRVFNFGLVVRGLSQRPKLTDGPIQRPGRKRN
jgi:hypothetical protein